MNPLSLVRATKIAVTFLGSFAIGYNIALQFARGVDYVFAPLERKCALSARGDEVRYRYEPEPDETQIRLDAIEDELADDVSRETDA